MSSHLIHNFIQDKWSIYLIWMYCFLQYQWDFLIKVTFILKQLCCPNFNCEGKYLNIWHLIAHQSSCFEVSSHYVLMWYWQANSHLYRQQQVQFETCATLFERGMMRAGTQSVKLSFNVWFSSGNRSRLFHCWENNNLVLHLDVSNDSLSFSHDSSSRTLHTVTVSECLNVVGLGRIC